MLFEYSDPEPPIKVVRGELEKFLQMVWEGRKFPYSDNFVRPDDPDLDRPKYQPFLRFDGDKFRTQNFVGFIHSRGQTIEIYPKVFKRSADVSKATVLSHLFYWFSYCSRMRWPVLDVPLDRQSIDTLPELLIWYFANRCWDVLSTRPFRKYQEVEEVLTSPRGRINFSTYIQAGLSNGNQHQVDCIYEPFVYDNSVNRAIKYVSRLLLRITSISETQNLLQETLFLLDEVDDRPCSSAELDRIHLNPLFTDYLPILEWCKRFLDQQLYSAESYDCTQWSMLLPMEYVFEDFLAGFIKRNLRHFGPEFKLKTQSSSMSLSMNPEAFTIIPDLILSNGETEIILDTKYKMRWDLQAGDVKKGVAQGDMYQMVSYAHRRGCRRVILLYPNIESQKVQEDSEFNVPYGSNEDMINIKICEVPFWNAVDHRRIEVDLKNRLGAILNV